MKQAFGEAVVQRMFVINNALSQADPDSTGHMDSKGGPGRKNQLHFPHTHTPFRECIL